MSVILGGLKEKKRKRNGAKNCRERAKGVPEGRLIIIQDQVCMDFTLQGRNDHLMKVFISQIHNNYGLLLNVSVLIYES